MASFSKVQKVQTHQSSDEKSKGGGGGSGLPYADTGPTQGYALKPVKPLDPRYLCGLCKLILRSPQQLSCGCRYCKPCAFEVLRKEPSRCEQCQEPLHQEQANRDAFAEREVQAVVVYCMDQDAGCQWTGTIKEFHDHYAMCAYKRECCTNDGCRELLAAGDLALHMKSECLFRRVRCEKCREEMVYHQLAKHTTEQCSQRPVLCRHCNQTVQANKLADHVTSECLEVLVDCEFAEHGCQEKVKRKNMESHVNNAQHFSYLHKSHKKLHQELEMTKIAAAEREKAMQKDLIELRQMMSSLTLLHQKPPLREITEQHPSSSSRSSDRRVTELPLQHGLAVSPLSDSGTGHSSGDHGPLIAGDGVVVGTMPQDIAQLLQRLSDVEMEVIMLRKKNVGEVREERQEASATGTGGGSNVSGAVEALKGQVRELESSVATNSKSIGIGDVQMADLSLRVDIIDVKSTDGVLVWKIGDIARRLREAQSARTPSLYSAPFYTSNCGYKMCARVYLNGDGMGRGKCISLFFVLMRGEYDALLPWPFQQRVTMLLLDQSETTSAVKRNITEVFKPERRSGSFQRPVTEMNTGSGCPLFAPASVLESPLYVRNDTIFIKVTVEKAGFEAPDKA